MHICLHYLLYYGTCILREKALVYKIIALYTHTKRVYQFSLTITSCSDAALELFLGKRTQSLKEGYPLTFKHILSSLLVYAINKPVIYI